ncbi:MAG: hypothetical protein O7C75_04930, partial [Verrucomicrobia bacterium]|nr:hypothetical protein [Verrucomicrobiota bacterium]
FVHTTHNEIFYAETSDPSVIAIVREELKKPLADRSLHMNGRIDRGANGPNGKWSWYYIANEWTLAEMSMELCDSWPSYVEENLDTWLEEVGSLCPWASRVSREL